MARDVLGISATRVAARTSMVAVGYKPAGGRALAERPNAELKRPLDTAPEFPKTACRDRLGSYVPVYALTRQPARRA